MSNFNIQSILRENIKNLTPYSSARHEYTGSASVFLDANENPYGSALKQNYNRYPDPFQEKLKTALSKIKGVPPYNTFIGNGSDEAIDILIRAFCRPGVDNIMVFPPTYGMYEVSANINDVEIKKVNLTPQYQLDLDSIADTIDQNTKIIFLCSPNNPTGNSISREDIEIVLNNFNGIVVVDEAYINYSRQKSFIQELTEYGNLVVLQTLSKAWGLAGLRIGIAFASQEIIDIFNRIKPPYNVNQASQQLALDALTNIDQINQWIRETIDERSLLVKNLLKFDFIEHVYPSDANFILVRTNNPLKIYQHLNQMGIIVRDRSKVSLCEGCLRITIGTPEENNRLLEVLKEFK